MNINRLQKYYFFDILSIYYPAFVIKNRKLDGKRVGMKRMINNLIYENIIRFFLSI